MKVSTVLLLLVLLFHATSFIQRGHYPASQDELGWLGAVDTLYQDGVPIDIYTPQQGGELVMHYSPHLFLWMMRASYEVFGPTVEAARVPGALSGLLLIVLLFFATRDVAGGGRAGEIAASIAILVCSAIPSLIQGSVILDIDNSILRPVVLGLCWACFRYLKHGRPAAGATIVLCTALMIWCRLTTPIVLLPVLAVFAFSSEHRSVRWKMPLLLTGGVGLFFATWAIYSALTGWSFSGPFVYTYEAFVNKAGGDGIRKLASSGIQFVLWTGYVCTVLLLWSGAARARKIVSSRRLRPVDLFAVSGGIIVLGYCVIGGAPFGFPKYHGPGLPLLCLESGLLLGPALARTPVRQWLVRLAPLGLCAAIVQWCVVGDPVMQFRVTLREAMVTGGARDLVLQIAFAGALALLLWAGIGRLMTRRGASLGFGTVLLALGIGTGFSAVVQQNVAAADTGYSYGCTEARDVAALLLEHCRESEAVIAPSEIRYIMAGPHQRFVENALWLDAPGLLKTLEDPGTRGLAMSIYTNTVAQLRMVSTNPEIVACLETHYELTEVGRFRVWLRR